MNTFIFVSQKSWHDDLFWKLSNRENENWIRIINSEEFNLENITKINPLKIFVVHWSYIIKDDIFNNFECIGFHMTDLPFGRGGSPLQNLIIRGIEKTKISAIKIEKGIDTGDIYLKRELSLEGSALEIYKRSIPKIYDMICEMVENVIIPQKQIGESVFFKRRNPAESNLKGIEDFEKLYNMIRMLDCEGYPLAYLDIGNLHIEFTNAILMNQEITANVRITKK